MPENYGHPKLEVIMGLEIEAVYQNGALKLEREIPLENGQRVRLTIHPPGGRVEKAYGLMGWQGTSEEFQQIALNPESGILESR
jgi:predicted DNA-binding antitoxin AbrB/MazE fold protein